MSSIVDIINHYQTSINKSLHDKPRIVHCIGKLYKLPISVRHLQDTGVGRTINSLRKFDGEVGIAAKALVTKWKAMVAAEESDDGASHNTAENDRNGNRQHRSDRSDEDDGTREENNDGAMAAESDHDDAAPPSDNGGDADAYEESQLRVDEEYRDDADSGSGSEDESDDQARQHHNEQHHHQIAITESKADANQWNDHHSSSSSTKEHHSSSSRSQNHHSSRSSASSDKHRSHKSDSRHHRHNGDDPKSHKSSLSRGEHSSSTKSSHSGDIRKKDRNPSKHHNTTGSSGTTEAGTSSNSSSSKRKDSSQTGGTDHQPRSREERSESSKRSASDREHTEDTTTSTSKRSRKDCSRDSGSASVESQFSTPHSKTSSKVSSSSSSSKHHDRHSRVSTAEKGREHGGKSKRKERKLDKHDEQESAEEDVVEGIDGSAGASFADALSMIGMPSTSKKKSSSGGGASKEKEKEKITVSKSSSASGSHSSKSKPSSSSSSKTTVLTAHEMLSEKVRLQPLPEASEIVDALPMISPNYRPMPLNQTVMECVFLGGQGGRGQKRPMTEEEALGQSMQSKNIRTKVYSGMKSTTAKGVIPSLYELCIRLLQDHIDEIGATGGIPFYILKPVLERANPSQLLHLEHYNPQFVDDSDILWELHCKRTFRGKQRNEESLETWREMFLRCSEERDAKLKSLTQNIKLAQEQAAAPIRKTQLAYVDSAVKPPRAVINKQVKYGTARAPVVSPAARVAALKSGNVAQVGDARLRLLPGARDNAQSQVFQPTKPRKAPMMAKVLSSMKGFKTSFRR
ncbi:transcription elongation factor B polypeptide 3 isoform X1 [Anopheles bellator]|uniref:transcription elongation factor B polypeptide 3 isoform X1 n=2 Tax=Anopheles bellator TaxID=139047 RepID=UPI0026490735|nr:transcription elongation factor B polypeptide 3 isoform X1 [Anopheles bellator]